MFFRIKSCPTRFLTIFMDPETIEIKQSILNTFNNPNVKTIKGRGEEFRFYLPLPGEFVRTVVRAYATK